jgi:hypothetical protein
MGDVSDNASSLGVNFLHIFLWVGVWEATESVIEYFFESKRMRLLIHLSIATIAAVLFITVAAFQ